MTPDVIAKLLEDVREEWQCGLESVALLGRTPDLMQFRQALQGSLGYPGKVELFTTDGSVSEAESRELKDWSELSDIQSRLIVIVVDDDKESVLTSARERLGDREVKVLLAGYGHYAFKNPMFWEISDSLLVPSIANGYANCLIHIFQCLEHAAETNLDGCVAEFGVFKGGTTRFIAETVVSLGQSWPIYGFDTFAGFPPRRSVLDMYDHHGAEYSRLGMVAQYLSDTNVELIQGDIVETASLLGEKPMVLTFIDTDNYSAARAAIGAVLDTTVLGGAIILDHFTGESRFRYTLGERIAANELLTPDSRYFNLHGTGVFLRCN